MHIRLDIRFNTHYMLLLSELRWRHADVFPEDAIKLRETGESTPDGSFRNGHLCADQDGLHIAYPCHLDVIGYGKAGDGFELMG